jgi:hypothetical protein
MIEASELSVAARRRKELREAMDAAEETLAPFDRSLVHRPQSSPGGIRVYGRRRRHPNGYFWCEEAC